MAELNEKDFSDIERFRKGFPWMDIVAPATVGHGIKSLSPQQVENAVATADAQMSGRGEENLTLAKFVPASGAASRMFKDLFNKNVTIVNKFVFDIDKFAFYDSSLYDGLKDAQLVDFTLLDSEFENGKTGLGYGSKPKGVLDFHRYTFERRTAIAEHLVEAKEYVKGPDKVAHLVVTISPEHRELFEKAIAAVKENYQRRYDVKYDIKFTCQQKWTDTLAVTPDNEAFLKDDGTPLHRPAGHGALIYNLSEVDADIVSIKNIDNVSVESYLPVTVKWKKVLIGTALEYRSRIFGYLRALKSDPTAELCAEAASFLRDELMISIPEFAGPATLISYLDRPIRVCGMVKNQGEPGGGPFIIRGNDGITSLQILEGAQINPADAHAVECLKAATHFNPVDLVCVIRDSGGRNFDLPSFVDEDAGFISSKSYQGRELKALELPGLWNGSMSRWNTVFVEVPVETFNPVKTVMDLLRPAHQG